MEKTRLPIIFEPTDRHIRVEFNDEIIADSTNAMLLRDKGHSIHYMFPKEDIKTNYLTPSNHVESSTLRGKIEFWNLQVGNQTADDAVWEYTGIPDNRPDTGGYLGIDWQKMDAWYEEAEEVLIHPRDPYHRVDAIKSNRHIRVEVESETIAETNNPILVFETGLPTRYYVPVKDVKMEFLTPTDHKSMCPYKGTASYWTIEVGDKKFENMAWGYKDPLPEIPKIKDTIAFYNEVLDIYVDGELEEKPKTQFA